MKKWLIFAMVATCLTGCGSESAKETSKSETSKETSTEKTSSSKQSAVKTNPSTSKEKVVLTEETFQIEESAYKVEIPDTWEVIPDEEVDFSAGNEDSAEVIMIYGMKKTDFTGLDSFKNAMIEQIVSSEDVQINEDTRKETAYQTTHYSGYLYSFTSVSGGANIGIQYYFLETEVDYIVFNVIGLPSFYNKNPELIPEMLNSFESIEQVNTQEL